MPRSAKLASAPTSRPVKRTTETTKLHTWATAGVWLTLVMSAALNGYSNSMLAPIQWAAWLMGLTIPAIVLITARVASLQWRKGSYFLAKLTAGVGVGLLALSIWHCSLAISNLTGSPLFLSFPMSLALDAGLVCFEIATVLE